MWGSLKTGNIWKCMNETDMVWRFKVLRFLPVLETAQKRAPTSKSLLQLFDFLWEYRNSGWNPECPREINAHWLHGGPQFPPEHPAFGYFRRVFKSVCSSNTVATINKYNMGPSITFTYGGQKSWYFITSLFNKRWKIHIRKNIYLDREPGPK